MAASNSADGLIDQIQIVEYSEAGTTDPVQFRLDPGTETIWASQAQIAALFAVDRSVVTKHISGVYSDGELHPEGTSAKFAQVQFEGGRRVTRQIEHYNLDMVISVGYRVNSKAATRFRQWATGTIRAFLEQGFVLDERALRASPEKLNALAAQIRELRSEEKQVFAKVRDCFKISASDYDPSSKQMRTFYALLQDKFHYAVTDRTSAKLIIDRLDHTAENMGLVSFSGERPKRADAHVGKNVLTREEMYRLHILSEQFLLFAEGKALSGKKMTMESLHRKLDELLIVSEYKVMDGWQDYLKPQAKAHADAEYDRYLIRLKVEKTGLAYSAEDYAAGLYDSVLA